MDGGTPKCVDDHSKGNFCTIIFKWFTTEVLQLTLYTMALNRNPLSTNETKNSMNYRGMVEAI